VSSHLSKGTPAAYILEKIEHVFQATDMKFVRSP
jgi:hypothetical protein